MIALKTTLLVLNFAAFQFVVTSAAALPVVTGYGHHTDRFGSNSIPLQPVGDKVQIAAYLDSTDPIGSPTISVEAVQGGTTVTLDPIPPDNPLFEGLHGYYKFIDFDPGLLGSWEITPTDSTGVGPAGFTNAIAEPKFLPLVEDVAVQGTPLGARVSWSLPTLSGFDVDGISVRVIELISGRHMWQSELLPDQTTSFVPPAGVLEVGVDYVYRINLQDLEGFDVENSSKTFSEPFRFTDLTVNGDFNIDGTVDAADYVTWRKGRGTIYDYDDYDAWHANFGRTLSAGSGAVIPSAAPLSAAIPEPTALALAALGLAPFLLRRKRINASDVPLV